MESEVTVSEVSLAGTATLSARCHYCGGEHTMSVRMPGGSLACPETLDMQRGEDGRITFRCKAGCGKYATIAIEPLKAGR